MFHTELHVHVPVFDNEVYLSTSYYAWEPHNTDAHEFWLLLMAVEKIHPTTCHITSLDVYHINYDISCMLMGFFSKWYVQNQEERNPHDRQLFQSTCSLRYIKTELDWSETFFYFPAEHGLGKKSLGLIKWGQSHSFVLTSVLRSHLSASVRFIVIKVPFFKCHIMHVIIPISSLHFCTGLRIDH